MCFTTAHKPSTTHSLHPSRERAVSNMLSYISLPGPDLLQCSPRSRKQNSSPWSSKSVFLTCTPLTSELCQIQNSASGKNAALAPTGTPYSFKGVDFAGTIACYHPFHGSTHQQIGQSIFLLAGGAPPQQQADPVTHPLAVLLNSTRSRE